MFDVVHDSLESIYAQLLAIGFLTGSRAFGTARNDSDYDIVFPVTERQRVNDIITGLDTTQSDYFAGFYINVDGKIINLIPVHPHEYLPWYLATKAMSSTLKDSGIVDPIKKYSVFMGIISFYKGTVDELGCISAYREMWDRVIHAII